MRIIMGTGSRSMVTDPNAKAIYKILEDYVLGIAERHGGVLLISGMAEGWDEAIAKVGMRNNIPYHVYIPTQNYGEYYWRDHSVTSTNRIEMFNQLVDGAQRVTFLEEVYGPYTMTNQGPKYLVDSDGETNIWLHANFARNAVMVQNSEIALVYNPQSPGTRDAVARLRRARKQYEVYPFTNKMFDPPARLPGF